MKTLRLFLLAAASSGLVATAVLAGPSGQILPVPPGSASRQYTPPPAQECKFMPSLVKSGTNTQLYEKCTSEMMKNDARCRAHCGK